MRYLETRKLTYNILNEPSRAGWLGFFVTAFLFALTLLVAAIVVVETIPEYESLSVDHLSGLLNLTLIVFIIEYLARLWSCVEDGGTANARIPQRLKYMMSPMALVDCAVILSLISGWEISAEFRVIRLITVFKFHRYFGALGVLNEAFKSVAPSLLAGIVVLSVLLLFTATGAFLFEHNAQPDIFASIPHSMWWAVATLTTVGYGDVYPVTVGGRIFGGLSMIIGIGFAALPAGLFASAMSEVVAGRKNEAIDYAKTAMSEAERVDDEYVQSLRAELPLSIRELRNLAKEIQVDADHDHCPKCGHALRS